MYFRKEIYRTLDGDIVVTLSGESGLRLAKLLAPTLEDTAVMLRMLRQRMKLSQAALGAVLGVPKHTLRRWEQGTRNPSGAARRLIWVMWRSQLELGLPDDLLGWVSWLRA